MTRWDAFTALCGHLRAGFLGGERADGRDIPWESLIEIASFHYVTPALAWCLKRHPNVPPEVRDYFDSAAALNERRNESMLAGLARTTGLLNAIDIVPMLLKGAAILTEGVYPEPSMRILGDIDILIPANRSADADAALKAAGFATKPSDVVPPPSHHHLPMLHDPETGMGVELHTDVISRSPDAVIATGWFCERARPARFRDRRIALPEPTRNAGHIIFHGEILHDHHALTKVQLRQLLDLAIIRKRHESAIDWDALDRRFSASGFGEVLATHLAFAEKLFGQPAPKLSHAPSKDAMAELRRMESRDGFHVQVETLQATCNRLLTDLSHMTATRDHFQFAAGRLEGDLANALTARDALAAAVAQTNAARDHFESETHRLGSELIRISNAHNQLVTDIDQMRAARDHFESEAHRLGTELIRISNAHNQMRATRDHFESETHRLGTELIRITNAHNQLVTDVDQMRAARDHFESEAHRLGTELIRITTAHNQLVADVDQMRAARDEAVAQVGAAMHANAELERELSAMRGSSSWRLTWPLRALATALRRWSGRLQ